MKKITTLLAFLLLGTTIGMAKTENANAVTGTYNRLGYSLIVVENEGSYSASEKTWVKNYQPESKFDYNNIRTRYMKPVTPHPDETGADAITRYLSESGIGHEITSFIFNRKPNGEMDDNLIKERGNYNATAIDEMDAAATFEGKKITLDNAGYKLLSKNYVILMQFFDYKKDDGNITAKGRASLCKIDYNQDFIDNKLYALTWIYPEDSKEVRAQKIKNYNNLKIKFNHVLSVQTDLELVSTKTWDGKAKPMSKCIDELQNSIYKKILYKFESSIEEFKVQVPIDSLSPIRARIGKKESLKNGRRYDAYYHTEDDEGNPIAVRRAVLRATTIGENRTDKEVTSEFVQISGYSLEDGLVLKQCNDLKSSLSANMRFGSLQGYGLKYEMLATIATNGLATYASLDANYHSYNLTTMNDGKYSVIDENPDLFDNGSWATSYISLGVSATYRFLRYFEVGATANIGMDFILTSWDDETYQNFTTETVGSAYAGSVGLMARANIFYPLQLYIAADAAFILDGGDDCQDYRTMTEIMEAVGMKSRKGIGFTMGLTYNF